MWPWRVKVLWYDLKKLLWQDELNPRVRCAFGNVFEMWLHLNKSMSLVHSRSWRREQKSGWWGRSHRSWHGGRRSRCSRWTLDKQWRSCKELDIPPVSKMFLDPVVLLTLYLCCNIVDAVVDFSVPSCVMNKAAISIDRVGHSRNQKNAYGQGHALYDKHQRFWRRSR